RSYNIPFGARHRDRLSAFYGEWEKKLDELDFAALSRDAQVDYLLFRSQIRHLKAGLDRPAPVDERARALVPFGGMIAELEEQRRTFAPPDPEAAASRVVEIGKKAKEARKVADGWADRAALHRAADWTEQLRSTLKAWQKFYSGYDPLFTWWVDKPWKDADKELEGYASFLRDKSGERKEGAEGLVGVPIGAEALKAEIAREMIPYAPEELVAIAEREFAW